jgi:DNA repair exonuclease SbcCD ATPase subunit
MTDTTTAAELARQAAEALDAEGKPVTARAVRERSGVRTSTAAEAAREWNDRRSKEISVPDMPETVAVRAAGFWNAAFIEARKEFSEAITGWQAKLDAAAKAHDELAAALDESEAVREQLVNELEKMKLTVTAEAEKITDLSMQLVSARETAVAAQIRAAAAEAHSAALSDVIEMFAPQKDETSD